MGTTSLRPQSALTCGIVLGRRGAHERQAISREHVTISAALLQLAVLTLADATKACCGFSARTYARLIAWPDARGKRAYATWSFRRTRWLCPASLTLGMTPHASNSEL